MQPLLRAGLSASNECRKVVVELILVSGHQPVGRALARNEKSLPKGEGSSCGRNSPSPCANAAVEARNNDATEQSREIRMVSLLRPGGCSAERALLNTDGFVKC